MIVDAVVDDKVIGLNIAILDKIYPGRIDGSEIESGSHAVVPPPKKTV